VLATRGWLTPESGESWFVSKDRCCKPEKIGKCIDRQIEWSAFGETSIVVRIVVRPLINVLGKWKLVLSRTFVKSELWVLILESLCRSCVCRGSGESVLLQFWISRLDLDQWCCYAVTVMCDYLMLASVRSKHDLRGLVVVWSLSFLVTDKLWLEDIVAIPHFWPFLKLT